MSNPSACPVHGLTSMPKAAIIIALAAIGALGFAYLMQYGFGLKPCELCLWQRLPFALVFVIATLAAFWRPYRKQTVILLILCAIIFVTGDGLAVFHSGVERHWWPGLSSCSAAPLSGSVADLRMQLLQTPVVRCDQISWKLFGLSMANWNIVYSTLLAVFAAWAALTSYRLMRKA